MKAMEPSEQPYSERPEFDAKLRVALALAQQLHKKLVAWGDEMQKRQKSSS